MSETKQLPLREEVATSVTWDLTKIFADDAAFERFFQIDLVRCVFHVSVLHG